MTIEIQTGMEIDMLNQFSRTQLLLGAENMDRLAKAKVAIFGIGGVGGYVAEALAEETGAEVLQLHSMQNVTAEEFSGGETYVSLMQKNLEALKEGLK